MRVRAKATHDHPGSRRQFLLGIGAVSAVLTGCIDDGDTGGNNDEDDGGSGGRPGY